MQRDLRDDGRVTHEGDAAFGLFVVADRFGRVVVRVLTIEVTRGRLEAQPKIHDFWPRLTGVGDASRKAPITLEGRGADVQHGAASAHHVLVVGERFGVEVHVLRLVDGGHDIETERVARAIRSERSAAVLVL